MDAPPVPGGLFARAAEVRQGAVRDRARARQLRLESVLLHIRLRRSRRTLTGAVLALFTEPPTGPDQPRTAPPTVLVVDDDDAVRGSIADLLEVTGYRILQAHDGDEALRVLSSDPVDVMVLDLRMPGRDGISVLEQLPLDAPSVIVHSAAHDVSTEIPTAALRAKVFRSLTKPVPPTLLLAAVGEAIDHGPGGVDRRRR